MARLSVSAHSARVPESINSCPPFRAAYWLGEYSFTPGVTNAAFERHLGLSIRKGIRPRVPRSRIKAGVCVIGEEGAPATSGKCSRDSTS